MVASLTGIFHLAFGSYSRTAVTSFGSIGHPWSPQGEKTIATLGRLVRPQ
jgi:hypothetical protein